MQTLFIKTSIPCKPQDLSQRRKNIISQAIDVLGRDGAHDLFHNHQGKKALHRYPLIQYRVHQKRLSIFAIGEAVPVLIKAIAEADLDNKSHKLNLNNVMIEKGKAQIKKSTRNEYYRLMDWVALNNETFNDKWKKSYTLIDRVALLNNAISGHLKILGQQLLPFDEAQRIDGELYMLTNRKTQKLYDNNVMGFNVIFKTPYHLPDHFALGRGISLGAGSFQKLRTNPEQGMEKIIKRNRKKSNPILEAEYAIESQLIMQ